MNLETQSLKLILHEPKHVLALIDGPEHYERSIGHKPANGLRDFFVSKEVSPEWLAKLKTATTSDPWTHGFGLAHKASGLMIGACGFKGPPGAEGMVEIAYGIVPGYQGKGYATEAAQALVSLARNSPGVRTIRAHTLPEKNASTRVLIKCGFHQAGEFHDPEDGLVWRWELPRREG
ncbi:MAG TPA: GNAT family N-acetyltransferase [Verrucomicrobiae bacterium]|nr:GNAT family N-acetyltransferase [Verrucomicrobiae bacterium]